MICSKILSNIAIIEVIRKGVRTLAWRMVREYSIKIEKFNGHTIQSYSRDLPYQNLSIIHQKILIFRDYYLHHFNHRIISQISSRFRSDWIYWFYLSTQFRTEEHWDHVRNFRINSRKSNVLPSNEIETERIMPIRILFLNFFSGNQNSMNLCFDSLIRE